MRNKRQLVGGFVLAAMMSMAMPLSADTGTTSGRSFCAFLSGILQKVGNPDTLQAVFERVFECSL